MEYPKVALVRQRFATAPISDIDAAVREELRRLDLPSRIRPGQRVAVTAGSRGIANYTSVLATLVEVMRELGAEPFIVAAMGSHGGATAAGQRQLLAGYGITEEQVGAPIHTDMEVVELAKSSLGLPVYFDRNAARADHVVIVNRVKPHTDFEAPIESGIVKMMTVGLGKQKGAEQYHNAVLKHGYYPILREHAEVIMAHAPIALGVALVENQLEQTQIIRACWREEIVATEMALLEEAKRLLPRLPFEEIDLLIVDEMGKDISGTCMDQNVIARTVIRVGTAPDKPKIRRIFVRDLTAKSQGMATGIGNADFTTTRLVEKIDREATYINCLAACEPEMGAIPTYYDTDREVLDRALTTIGTFAAAETRLVHIRNTLELQYLMVSEALLAEAGARDDLEILTPPGPLRLSAGGNIEIDWPEQEAL